MLGAANLTQYIEEGEKAFRDGKQEWENPYNFITETLAAYAWEQGYRTAKKEAA